MSDIITPTIQSLDHSHELHMMRLESRSISNQLYFLRDVLAHLGKNNIGGPQLYPVAIRGLCQHLTTLEEEALGISERACKLLGIPEDTVEEDFA